MVAGLYGLIAVALSGGAVTVAKEEAPFVIAKACKLDWKGLTWEPLGVEVKAVS